ncbi:hypothetical protein QTP86_021448, partial [Hemibagrus guttatus]
LMMWVRAVWTEPNGEEEGVIPEVWVKDNMVHWSPRANATKAANKMQQPMMKAAQQLEVGVMCGRDMWKQNQNIFNNENCQNCEPLNSHFHLEKITSRHELKNLEGQLTDEGKKNLMMSCFVKIGGANLEDCVEKCDEKDSDKNNFEHIPFGILTVNNEDSPHCSSLIPVHSVSTFIIIEGGIVMDDVRDLPLAVCLFFGVSYALHLDYPKCMKNTFNFIQQVILDLGSKSLKQKLQTF